ncbi:MAG: orotate phosphoribosyltransferase [Bacteroidetes bacterium]|nr:orotate phosphoribosyltransferase [Bacteroidota bacterium]
MTDEKILETFKSTNALLEGHFLLTSGRHSNKYFQCAQVLQYTKQTSEICQVLAEEYKDKNIETVIAPAIGGIVVGQEVARQLGARFIWAEREDKKMTLRRSFEIKKGERVLVCEDVVTTGGSVQEVIDIAKEKGAVVVGVGVIVDRSNGKADFGVPMKSTLQLEVISYEPDNCPICKEGLELVKPGSRKIK